jgi:hypothetical protein
MPKKSSKYVTLQLPPVAVATVKFAINPSTGEIAFKVHPKKGYVIHSIAHPTSYAVWVSKISKKMKDP